MKTAKETAIELLKKFKEHTPDVIDEIIKQHTHYDTLGMFKIVDDFSKAKIEYYLEVKEEMKTL